VTVGFSQEGAVDVSAFRHVPVSLSVEGASRARLEQLYREHHSNVVREFQRLTSPADAEDLAQETFLTVGVSLAKRCISDPVGYLWAAVRNRARNWLRDRREHVSLDEQAERELQGTPMERGSKGRRIERELKGRSKPSAETCMCAETRKDALVAEIGRLTPGQRQAYALVDLRGFSESETAEMLGSSRGTVSTLRTRARMSLRDGYLLADAC
jgi:RNA polymerase sigma factor (sigma-70 family)